MGNFVYIYPTHGHLHWTFWQNISQHKVYVCTLWWWPEENIRYTFFRQSTTFTKLGIAFVLGLQTLLLQDFSEIYQLKGLKPKNKGHMNVYECYDLTKKVYLKYLCIIVSENSLFSLSFLTINIIEYLLINISL